VGTNNTGLVTRDRNKDRGKRQNGDKREKSSDNGLHFFERSLFLVEKKKLKEYNEKRGSVEREVESK
jgi:hypothetical protein